MILVQINFGLKSGFFLPIWPVPVTPTGTVFIGMGWLPLFSTLVLW